MRTLVIILWSLAVGTLAAIETDPPTTDPRWKEAVAAYGAGRNDEGHNMLIEVVRDNPGDLTLATVCYTRILEEEGRKGAGNPWIALASKRLMALERLGALSANTSIARAAFDAAVVDGLNNGRHLEVREFADRMRKDNSHDLFWRMLQANAYALMDLAEARPLFATLREELDPDHPDAVTRDRWKWVETELKKFDSLPKPILPLPEGSPLTLMEPDDPDGWWRIVMDRSPADIVDEVDRLAAMSFASDQIVLWQDMSGLTDPPRALDLHLLSKPPAELKALRKEQEENFRHENARRKPPEAEVLRLSRRFPWARSTQRLLLELANTALWEGRADSALRSFHEILVHTVDPGLKDAAQVGYWTALALSGGAEELRATAGTVDPGKKFGWMGKEATAPEIRASLLSGITPPTPPSPPALQNLAQIVLQLPPVSPWPTDTPSGSFGVDLQVAGGQVIVSGRNMLVSYDPANSAAPAWAQLQRHPIEENRKTGYHPGYFRPLIEGDTIFTRWGLTSLPSGLAAFDLATGSPLWSHQDTNSVPSKKHHKRFQFAVPTGDPVRADGMLFYLQWGTERDVADRNGRNINLVAFDLHQRKQRWTNTIATAGRTTDIIANFENATPQSAIYGNAVTAHRGAVYCNSNAGLIARCDVRDGRVDWIHYYRRTRSNLAAENLGAAPIVVGDTIICMPRDAGRVFALDQRTGRLLWDNPMVLAVEAVGVFEDTLVVRGVGTLAGLDLATGDARWFRPLPERTLGRSELIGDSVYVGEIDELRRFDARTGTLLEKRDWNLGEDRPLAFTLTEKALYVVSDRPAAGVREQIGQALGRDAPAEPAPLTLPLRRSWTLPRSDARIALAPHDSGLSNTAFLLSGGILECLDLSPRGAILWHRFVDAHNATLNFIGDKLLLVEHPRSAHTGSRAIALDARAGTFLWEAPLPAQLGHSYQFASKLLYHDRRGKMVAIDIATGQRAWERKLGEANLVEPFWDGGKLHVFHASLWQGPYHLTLDPDTGETLSRTAIVTGAPTNAAHGRLVENGYYEVRFDPTPAQSLRFTTLSDVGGRGWASAAEFHVLGPDGKPIPRNAWKVEGKHETQAFPRALPRNLIDGDASTWWHSQWIDGIPNHPHDIFIDLGGRHTVTGFHYLPAKIINNNGMLRDYELRLRTGEAEWGDPVAKGILVNRLHVDRAEFGPGALFFEARNYPGNERAVFRYDFSGKPSLMVENHSRLLGVQGRYALIIGRNADNKEILLLRRSDDPNYRFDLSPQLEQNRHGEVVIDGDRLITGRHKLVLADLATRQFIDIPKDEKSPREKQGPFVRLGSNHFLKMVREGDKQALAMIDMNTGQVTEGTMENQAEQFQEGHFLRPSGQRILSFDRTLLFYDNSILSAWIAAQ